jgi:S1-C subfamily serine protease
MIRTHCLARAFGIGCLIGSVVVGFIMVCTAPEPPHFSDSVVQVTRPSPDGEQALPYASAVAIRETPEGTFFLTARHVVNGTDTLMIRPNFGFEITIPVVVVSVSEVSDLAMFFVPALRYQTIAEFGEEDPGFLDALTLVGRTPFGLTVTEGKLNHKLSIPWEDQNWLTHTAHIHGGCSGGGLFDADGKLIGINVAMGVQGFSPVSHVAMAVPLSEIRRFLHEGR